MVELVLLLVLDETVELVVVNEVVEKLDEVVDDKLELELLDEVVVDKPDVELVDAVVEDRLELELLDTLVEDRLELELVDTVDDVPGNLDEDVVTPVVVVSRARVVRVVVLPIPLVVDVVELVGRIVPPGIEEVVLDGTVVVVPPDTLVEVVPDKRVVVVVGSPGTLDPGRGIGSSLPSSQPINAAPMTATTGE